jgi:UPF0271 protein
MKRIDLNADVGEGLETDEALLAFVTSANIACGAHAGDEATMRRTVRLCLKNKVGIGAHPGYADRENFGRVALNLPAADIAELVAGQVRLLTTIAQQEGALLRHVKPHGALSNQAMADIALARNIAQAVKSVSPDLIFLAPAGTALERAGFDAGLKVVSEIFADRAYDAQGLLLPRKQPGAVLHEAQAIAQRILSWLDCGQLPAITGEPLKIAAQSVCVHGDTLEAVAIARNLREQLQATGVILAPF